MKKYNIDDLHQDLNSIYADYDRGKIDKKLVTETAFNICQAFVRDNQPKLSKVSIKDNPQSFVQKMKYQAQGYKLKKS